MLEAEYISVTQFAQKFGKDVGNVRKLIKDGRIPAMGNPCRCRTSC